MLWVTFACVVKNWHHTLRIATKLEFESTGLVCEGLILSAEDSLLPPVSGVSPKAACRCRSAPLSVSACGLASSGNTVLGPDFIHIWWCCSGCAAADGAAETHTLWFNPSLLLIDHVIKLALFIFMCINIYFPPFAQMLAIYLTAILAWNQAHMSGIGSLEIVIAQYFFITESAIIFTLKAKTLATQLDVHCGNCKLYCSNNILCFEITLSFSQFPYEICPTSTLLTRAGDAALY